MFCSRSCFIPFKRNCILFDEDEDLVLFEDEALDLDEDLDALDLDEEFDFDEDLRVEFAIIFLYEIKKIIIYLTQTQHPIFFDLFSHLF